MNRVAIITGASQGLGLALARQLATRGFVLAVDARRVDRLADAEAQLAAVTRVTAVAGDVTDPEHRRRLVAAATELGPIEVLVNNASTLGESPLRRLDDVEPDTLRRAFETNVVAPLALYQLVVPHFADGAVVVNITSDAAVEGYPTWGAYGASKAAPELADRVLAAERPDVRVLTVDPGDMRTEMHQDAFPGEDISDRPPPETSVPGIVALIEGDQPSGRYAAREIAG